MPQDEHLFDIKKGQVYEDNDPRSDGRRGVVVEVDADGERAQITWRRTRRTTSVSFKRLRSNAKTGYTLVEVSDG